MSTVHIGCGAGFAGDRFDAALPILADMARRDGPKYLIYEVLGERTLALAQKLRRRDAEAGYSPYLEQYLRLSLAEARRLGVRIVSNLGAANPAGAARRVAALAAELAIPDLTVAAVTGDDLTAYIGAEEIAAQPTMEGIPIAGRPVVAANAYLGARPIAEALALGADVVLVGRTTDSALALGPLIHEFGWGPEDWDRLAAGTICGHLLECGGQLTGTYFADPGFKDVPDVANAGFPIAEIAADGRFTVTKPAGTGGCVTRATVTEQLLYEMHDPAAYIVADCVADVTALTLGEAGPDRIAVDGVRGRPAPATLKATVCVDNGWLAEAELSYAGPNALARADLAGEIVRQRLSQHGHNGPLRIETLGTGAVHDGGDPAKRAARRLPGDGEYRLRVAAPAADREGAERIADEVLSLYCSGPAAGGGYRRHVFAEMATASILLPRDRIEREVRIETLAAGTEAAPC
ncbi:MAG: acyclic terpene utilization AtuA family protein [Pseudomonadota bacterium]